MPEPKYVTFKIVKGPPLENSYTEYERNLATRLMDCATQYDLEDMPEHVRRDFYNAARSLIQETEVDYVKGEVIENARSIEA